MSTYGVHNKDNLRVAVATFEISNETFPYEATFYAPSGFKIGYTKKAYDSHVIDVFNDANVWIGRGDIFKPNVNINSFRGFFKINGNNDSAGIMIDYENIRESINPVGSLYEYISWRFQSSEDLSLQVASQTTIVGRVLPENITDIERQVEEHNEWIETNGKGVPIFARTTVGTQSIVAGLSTWVLGLL